MVTFYSPVFVHGCVLESCCACTACVRVFSRELSLFGDLMCWSIFLRWGLMDCLCLQKTRLNPAWIWLDVFFLVGYKLSHHSVSTEVKPCPSHLLSVFTLTLDGKLGQRFWSELLHLTFQPTFAAACKGLSFWITFLPLWQISVPAEHFHSINLLFLCSSPTIRYGTSFLRVSNSNLVKKCTDWTMSAVPTSLSWQNVFIEAKGYCP